MRKLILIFLLLLWSGIAWADTETTDDAASSSTYDWNNGDSVMSVDGKFANTSGSEEEQQPIQTLFYTFTMAESDTCDSISVGIVGYDADADAVDVGLLVNSVGYGTPQSTNFSTSLDTTYFMFTGLELTRAQINDSMGVELILSATEGADTSFLDGFIVTRYSHSTIACTLGIDSVTITQISHSKAIFQVDGHCGWDTVIVEVDTSTAYGTDSVWATADTTFGDTVGLPFIYIGTWHYRVIVSDAGVRCTTTGTWEQEWMVDYGGALVTAWAYNGGNQYYSDIQLIEFSNADFDSFITCYSTDGFQDSSGDNRTVIDNDVIASDNFITVDRNLDTIYTTGWFVEVAGGELNWSPRHESLFVAYDSALIVAATDSEITMQYWADNNIAGSKIVILADTSINPPTTRNDSCTSCSLVTAYHLIPNKKYRARAIITRNGQGSDTSAVDSVYTSWIDTSTAPYDLKVTTFRSERDDSAGYGENNPDQTDPISYITWLPRFSSRIMQDSVVACSINVGTMPAGNATWRAYRAFSDTFFRDERTPKIAYVCKTPSSGADTGQILQDNVRYWWRMKTMHVNGTWGAWSIDSGCSFTGIQPSQWWSSNYSNRRNILMDSLHSQTPIDYTHEIVLPTGYPMKVAGAGLPNEAGNTFAALDGNLYFAWIGACTTSGWNTSCGHYVRQYDYSNQTWSDSQWAGPVICEAHFSPHFMFDDRKILWYLQGPHYSKMRLMRTKYPATTVGACLSDTGWFGGYGKTTYANSNGIIYDTSKHWGTDSLVGWYVSYFTATTESPMKITSNTDTSLITNNVTKSINADNNYYVYQVPDSGQTYYDTSGFWATYPYMYMPDSNFYIFARDRYHQDGMFDYYGYVHSTNYGVTWSKRKYVWINQPHAATSNSAYATTYFDATGRAWVAGSFWWCYGCDAQAARGIFLMYSDPDANKEYTKWYSVWGDSIGVTQADTHVTSSTVYWNTVVAANAMIATCEDPFGGVANDSAAGGGLIEAANDYGLTTVSGSPVVSFAYFDSANNYQPSFECVAKPDYDRQEWIIDNLSNRTKFVSRDTASHTAYWIKIVNGTTGKKFIIHDGASTADTFDNITSTQILRTAVNEGYEGINGGDSCTFVKVLWVGMDLPANDSANFYRTGTGTYSYNEFDATNLYRLWNFRNGGQVSKSGDNVYVYGFEMPTGKTYYGGEASMWTGSNLDSAGTPTWSRTEMSANSGRGYGRFSPLPEPTTGINQAVSFGRDGDVLVATNIDFPGMLNNGNDIRIVKGTFNGSTVTWTQYPRLPDYFDQESTHVYFNLKTIWPAGQKALTNSVLQIYYGASAENSLNPPAYPDTVFNFYESWEAYANEDTATRYNGWTNINSNNRVFCYYNDASGYAPQPYWTGYLHGGSNFMRMTQAPNGYQYLYKSLSRSGFQVEAWVSAIDSIIRPFIRVQDISGNYASLGVDAVKDSGAYNASWDTTWRFGGQYPTGQLGLQTLHHLKLVVYAESADSVRIKGYVNNNLIWNVKRGNILNPISRLVLGSRKTITGAGNATFDGITVRRYVATPPTYTIRDVRSILGGSIRRLRYTKELMK